MITRLAVRMLVAALVALVSSCVSQPPPPPLHAAIKNGSVEEVRARLAAGDDASQREPGGMTPVQLAISLGRREIALELIRSGADVKARTRAGATALSLAVDKGYQDVIDRLLERGAAIESADIGSSALFNAVRSDDAALIDRFLRAGAKVNQRNHDGETALHLAANLGRMAIMERLLSAGADLNAPVGDGRTPIHYAVLNNKFAAADLLYARGAAIAEANGELGRFTTALLYRHIAESDYKNRARSQAIERLRSAKTAFQMLEPMVAARADELSNQVLKGQVLNALALFVGAAKANIDARTSLSGTGSAVVPLRSTTDPAQLRDSYRGIAAWCATEASRMDAIIGCLSNATDDGTCFERNRPR